jgi:hypothetical protein
MLLGVIVALGFGPGREKALQQIWAASAPGLATCAARKIETGLLWSPRLCSLNDWMKMACNARQFWGFIQKLIADHDGSDHAGQLGHQRAGHGMARALNAHGSKVHGQHVERGFGAALIVAAARAAKLSTPCACMVSISMARAALPEKGLTSAVGRASTKRASTPGHLPPSGWLRVHIQVHPEARNTPTAQHGDQIGQQAFGDIKALWHPR